MRRVQGVVEKGSVRQDGSCSPLGTLVAGSLAGSFHASQIYLLVVKPFALVSQELASVVSYMGINLFSQVAAIVLDRRGNERIFEPSAGS